MLLVVGTMFFAGGILGAILAVNLGKGNERWLALPIGLVVPAVGALILFFSLRHRLRKNVCFETGCWPKAESPTSNEPRWR